MSDKTSQMIRHYQCYIKFYGQLIVELADSEEEVLKMMCGDNTSGLLEALRIQIENSLVCEEETDTNTDIKH